MEESNEETVPEQLSYEFESEAIDVFEENLGRYLSVLFLLSTLQFGLL